MAAPPMAAAPLATPDRSSFRAPEAWAPAWALKMLTPKPKAWGTKGEHGDHPIVGQRNNGETPRAPGRANTHSPHTRTPPCTHR
jgi:hypothetical protein